MNFSKIVGRIGMINSKKEYKMINELNILIGINLRKT